MIMIPGAPVFDLALQKSLNGGAVFESGSEVMFTLRVINQGTIDATNVEVTDYIPAGLTLNDAAWTQSGQTATRIISSIPAGQTQNVMITFTIDADAPESITNFAEISEDNAPAGNEDCDSIPDGINGNQPGENDGTQIDDNI